MAVALSVFPVGSDQFWSLAQRHKLTIFDLETMIDKLKEVEGVTLACALGLGEFGFFGSTNKNWSINNPEDSIHFVPWVQIYELLGRVPVGTTQEYLASNGKLH